MQYQQQLTITEENFKQLVLRENLVSSLLNAKNQNVFVQEYFDLIKNEFLPFADDESSLKEEASTILKLNAIGDELKIISSNTEFYKKRTVAISGGFSAGKSEFISSLFQTTKFRLPSGIEPTTAIPTYVMNSGSHLESLYALNNEGGKVDLLAISPDFYANLSHKFINDFKFNLKSIMPHIFLTTPLSFNHLCFVDTPGYNATETAGGFTGEDIHTAQHYSHSADAIIWLIGLDSNGTISTNDLQFLSEILEQDENKKLYIVLNKADLRPKSAVEDVLDTILETLEDEDINFEGISAYSSIQKTEIAYRNKTLFQFLESIDKESDKHHQILDKLFEIDQMYQYAILQEIKHKNKVFDQLNKILDGVSGDDTIDQIKELKALFKTKDLENQLARLGEVMRKLEQAINRIFGKESLFSSRKILTKNLLFETSLPWISKLKQALVDLQILQAQVHLQTFLDELLDKMLNFIDQVENVEQVFEILQGLREHIREDVENILSPNTTIDDSEVENALVSQFEQAQAHLQILLDEKLNAIDQAENVEQAFELVQDIRENIGEQVENIFSSITIDA